MNGENPVEQLTQAQRACVRMVGAGPSKIIAKRLGLSPHTVDNHLKAAMRQLGVHSRHDAAQLLARWEAAPPDQNLVSQSPPLAAPGRDVILVEPAAIAAEEYPAPALGSPAGSGEVRNVRSPMQTIALIAAIVVGIAITAAAALPISQGFQALSDLLQSR